MIDPAGGYAYFGTATGVVVKINLSDFTREAALPLGLSGGFFRSAVIDPAAGYAYFGTSTAPGTVPDRVSTG